MFPFGNKNLIGVDIGAYSVKVVKFRGGKGAFTLEGAACLKLPKEAGAGTATTAVTGLIMEIIRSQRIGGRFAAAAFPGNALTMRHIYLPSMPEKDLKEAVRWEIRKELTFPANELLADYVLAGGAAKTEANMLSIIAFAAKKSDADDITSAVKNAGLELRAIESVPTALLAAFNINNIWEDGVNYAMLDIGENRSTLAILKDRRLNFVREISFGGVDLTVAAAEASNKEASEAEEYKAAHGMTAEAGEDGDKVTKRLSGCVEGLCSELHRSFDYYQAQFREGAVGKLFLSGGSAQLAGIDGFITT
ncbi:MAG: type IV pilus assembly protein PilM, partial [Deltaproteobacteria bacterium]|nr:type IV pilus assembly protein PilM [Deltaproteobacteria bacterium]